jgi:hypothetical protein
MGQYKSNQVIFLQSATVRFTTLSLDVVVAFCAAKSPDDFSQSAAGFADPTGSFCYGQVMPKGQMI